MKPQLMFIPRSIGDAVAIALALLFILGGLLYAGDNAKTASPPSTGGPSGAKLWAQTCTQCHNARPPKEFSNAQWDVIVHHMQVRAKLTLSESHVIAEFLKNGK
jgi:mono/diheme cytochrome c family protein